MAAAGALDDPLLDDPLSAELDDPLSAEVDEPDDEPLLARLPWSFL